MSLKGGWAHCHALYQIKSEGELASLICKLSSLIFSLDQIILGILLSLGFSLLFPAFSKLDFFLVLLLEALVVVEECLNPVRIEEVVRKGAVG